MYTIEPTPKPKSFTCKALVWIIAILLWISPWLLLMLGVWLYGWIVGVGFGIFGYLLVGLVSSKMRHLSVPQDQREISFNSLELARWFTLGYLLCEKR